MILELQSAQHTLSLSVNFMAAVEILIIFVVDAALIYESGADTHMDYVIVVCSKIALRTERVLSRGKISRDEFLQRSNLQWTDEDKIQLADFVIHNNETKENLEIKAKSIYRKLI